MFSGSFLYANDVEGVYPPSYYAASADPLEPFPALEGPVSCDVCVVGAGYTGLSSALHLTQRGYDVVLLDAHRVGWGASGRNGGQVASGQRKDQEALEQSLGEGPARRLWDLAQDANALVKSLSADHAIDCQYKDGSLHADHKRRYVDSSKAYAEKLQRDYDYDQIRFVPETEIGDLVGSETYYGGTLDMGAGHLHPLRFALGLAHAAVGAGVRIHEMSRVNSYKNSSNGKTVQITTDSGEIDARFLILACNGYLDDLDTGIASRVMPINNYIIATEPLGEERARSLIRDDVAVSDSRFVVNYYRMSNDHRLLFGGGENYSHSFPADIRNFVRRPMLQVYPQLHDVKIDYGWGGTLAITGNRMPYVARLSDNVMTACGYSGNGVAMAALAGQVMADAVDGTLSRFDVLADVPTMRFPGGRHLRWPLLVLAMTYFALRDRL